MMIVLKALAMFHWKVFLGGSFLAAALFGSLKPALNATPLAHALSHASIWPETIGVLVIGVLTERLIALRAHHG